MEKYGEMIINKLGFNVVSGKNNEVEMIIDKASQEKIPAEHYSVIIDKEGNTAQGTKFEGENINSEKIRLIGENETSVTLNGSSWFRVYCEDGKYVFEITTHRTKTSNKLSIHVDPVNMAITVFTDNMVMLKLNQHATYAKCNGRIINLNGCNVENYYELIISAIKRGKKGWIYNDENFQNCLDIIKNSLVYTLKCFVEEWKKKTENMSQYQAKKRELSGKIEDYENGGKRR